MARYQYGYVIYRNDWDIARCSMCGRQHPPFKYADLMFDLKVVNENAYPIRRGDTVARLKWVANKTKPHKGWQSCDLTINPTGYGRKIDVAKVGLRLVDRIVTKWGFAPELELVDTSNYWYYYSKISDKANEDDVLDKYEKFRDDYEVGRISWLDPWALVLYAFPAMKIHRYIRDQRISDFVKHDEIEEPGSDRWIDMWETYSDGDTGYFSDGAAVGCLAPNEQVAKARLEEEFFGKNSTFGFNSEKWQTRRQAWLDADRPVIDMTTRAHWSYELPVDHGLEHELAIPSM